MEDTPTCDYKNEFEEERLFYNADMQHWEVRNGNNKPAVFDPRKYTNLEDCLKAALKHIKLQYTNKKNKALNLNQAISNKYGDDYSKSNNDKVIFDLKTETWKIDNNNSGDSEGKRYKSYPVSIFGKDRAKELAFQYIDYLEEKGDMPEEFPRAMTVTNMEHVYYSNYARAFYVKFTDESDKKHLKYFRVQMFGFEKAKEEVIKYAKELGLKLLDEKDQKDPNLNKSNDNTVPCPIDQVRFYYSKNVWLTNYKENGMRKTRTFSQKKYGFLDSQKMALQFYFEYMDIKKTPEEINKLLVSKESVINGLKKKGYTNVLLD